MITNNLKHTIMYEVLSLKNIVQRLSGSKDYLANFPVIDIAGIFNVHDFIEQFVYMWLLLLSRIGDFGLIVRRNLFNMASGIRYTSFETKLCIMLLIGLMEVKISFSTFWLRIIWKWERNEYGLLKHIYLHKSGF